MSDFPRTQNKITFPHIFPPQKKTIYTYIYIFTSDYLHLLLSGLHLRSCLSTCGKHYSPFSWSCPLWFLILPSILFSYIDSLTFLMDCVEKGAELQGFDGSVYIMEGTHLRSVKKSNFMTQKLGFCFF